jgi:probable HAF family extracellular repeat protein
MKLTSLLGAVAAACAVLTPSTSTAATFGPYQASYLNLIDTGGPCYFNALNKTGQAVGACFDADQINYTAYATDKNGKNGHTVGLLPGGNSSWTNGLNDKGILVGDAKTAGDSADHAFYFDPSVGEMVDLGTPGGTNSYALAINRKGTIAGMGNPVGDVTMNGFVIRKGQMIDLGTLPGGTQLSPWFINSSDNVAGSGTTANGEFHAFYATPGKYRLTDLGTLGGTRSIASGLNDQGVIVGTSRTPGDALNRAFYSSIGSSSMADLGTPSGLSTTATGINNLNQIVGRFQDPATGAVGFYICSLDAQCTDFTDLSTLVTLKNGATLQAIFKINDNGMIVVLGSDNKFYLLRPN